MGFKKKKVPRYKCAGHQAQSKHFLVSGVTVAPSELPSQFTRSVAGPPGCHCIPHVTSLPGDSCHEARAVQG